MVNKDYQNYRNLSIIVQLQSIVLMIFFETHGVDEHVANTYRVGKKGHISVAQYIYSSVIRAMTHCVVVGC